MTIGANAFSKLQFFHPQAQGHDGMDLVEIVYVTKYIVHCMFPDKTKSANKCHSNYFWQILGNVFRYIIDQINCTIPIIFSKATFTNLNQTFLNDFRFWYHFLHYFQTSGTQEGQDMHKWNVRQHYYLLLRTVVQCLLMLPTHVEARI